MEIVEFDNELRTALYDQAQRLQSTATSGRSIPMPERKQMKEQATTLYDQWQELEAARFNDAADGYEDAVQSMKAAIEKLEEELDAFNEAVTVLERATAVIKVVDRLLNLAVR